MWAARYSNNIDNDIARGFSFAGWGLTPAQSPREAWRVWAEYADPSALYNERLDEETALDRLIERYERDGYHVAQIEDGRYLVALPGLSAFVGETREEAIEAARADERFDDTPLWTFPCRILSIDEDAAVWGGPAAVVEPIGPAECA